VKRVADLTDDENIELWRIAHKLGKQLESYHNASSLRLAIQVRHLEKSLPHVLYTFSFNLKYSVV